MDEEQTHQQEEAIRCAVAQAVSVDREIERGALSIEANLTRYSVGDSPNFPLSHTC